MSFEFKKKLPTPEEIKAQYPVPGKLKALKEARDREICDVVTGRSDKFLVIIGPCSADNEEAVVDYTNRLASIYEVNIYFAFKQTCHFVFFFCPFDS